MPIPSDMHTSYAILKVLLPREKRLSLEEIASVANPKKEPTRTDELRIMIRRLVKHKVVVQDSEERRTSDTGPEDEMVYSIPNEKKGQVRAFVTAYDNILPKYKNLTGEPTE